MKHSITLALFAFACIAQARAQKSEVFAPGGIAIKGYDPVAFFKQSKPVKGFDKFSYKYKGTSWLFSSKENLDAFKESPEKYAPQYGGYCAYGTADGHKAPTEADTWTIVNDKLYFNYDKSVKESWAKDKDRLIKVADQKWPQIKGQ